MKRLLLLGPHHPDQFTGGLQVALLDVERQLRAHGWQVTVSRFDVAPHAVGPADVRTAASGLQRFAWWNSIRKSISPDLRKMLSVALWPAEAVEVARENLDWIARELQGPSPYDVVVISPEYCPPGALALVHRLHRRVAVLSLSGLAAELNGRFWGLARLRSPLSGLFRRVQPGNVKCAILASRKWKDDAVAAGLDARAAHAVYFWIDVQQEMPARPEPGYRLLWLGRLVPEKGLHLLLPALPGLRQQFPQLHLTAVCGPGDDSYRLGIELQIRELGLGDCVRLEPLVPREKLAELYASHDALFFHSMYAEPVALVLMEAYAAGIPVVANAVTGSDLVADGATCLTYGRDVAAAIASCLTDRAGALQRARNAHRLVVEQYSLETMGRTIDTILRSI